MKKTLAPIILSFFAGLLVAEEKPNILLLCIDDLRPELHCYGVDYIHSPNIDSLAARGVRFDRHYVQAPTCGASRFTLLTGSYGGSNNNALFQRADRVKEDPESVHPSMPAYFRGFGYETVSVGKVSHHPGGLGGKHWADTTILEMPVSWDRHLLPVGAWQHPEGFMHGLANGEIRKNAGEMDVFQSVAGPDTIYPDGLTTEEGIAQLERLAGNPDKPFFLAVGIIRPHLPFGAPEKYMEPYEDTVLPDIPHPEKPEGKTTWHKSGEFMKYNRWGRDPNSDPEFAAEVRKHYAACVSYADAQVGELLETLEKSGADKNTVVVLWGDHGWHLGEHAVWGKHTLFEESLLSPLIVAYPGIPNAGASTKAIAETLDIFPTLCELSDLPLPEYAQGESLLKMIENPASAEGDPAISYHRKSRSIRTDTHRLIVHEDGELELYDHRNKEAETNNLASKEPEVAARLKGLLEERMPAILR
ncbi:MAG: iduronate-2-sulfatase [Verrucomicrobiales bacterium]|nr:iduronate-2-sulfatase [Verrucomicrobiales bacterium]